MARLTTLPNGLRIITEEMPGFSSASIGLWVMAGSRHERAEQNGIAHFLEHMAFKGTTRRSAVEISETIEKVGGYINAYTSKEVTAYYAKVLSGDVPLAIDVVADIVMNQALAAPDVEKERGVILQEIWRAADDPEGIVFSRMYDASFPDQPFGRGALGTAELVSGFGEADLRAFMAEHYSPGRMILAAAGGVDHDAIVGQARRLFADLLPLTAPAAVPAVFSSTEQRVVHDLEQAQFILALEAPEYSDATNIVASIYSAVLGSGMSSRLYQKIREEKGLCYSIYSDSWACSDCGSVYIYSSASPDNIGELVSLAVGEVRRSADDITEAEVAKARASFRAGVIMSAESTYSVMERMALTLGVFGLVETMDERLAKIDAVDAAAVREWARGIPDRGVALALYGPVEGAPTLEEIRKRMRS